MKAKHCPHCMVTKPLDQFHRDSKGKDGRSARCALCRNASKRVVKPFKEYNGKKYELPRDFGKVKIPIAQEINDQLDELYGEDPLTQITKKYNCHWHLSVEKTGKTVLQIHTHPETIYRGFDVNEVIADALVN